MKLKSFKLSVVYFLLLIIWVAVFAVSAPNRVVRPGNSYNPSSTFSTISFSQQSPSTASLNSPMSLPRIGSSSPRLQSTGTTLNGSFSTLTSSNNFVTSSDSHSSRTRYAGGISTGSNGGVSTSLSSPANSRTSNRMTRNSISINNNPSMTGRIGNQALIRYPQVPSFSTASLNNATVNYNSQRTSENTAVPILFSSGSSPMFATAQPATIAHVNNPIDSHHAPHVNVTSSGDEWIAGLLNGTISNPEKEFMNFNLIKDEEVSCKTVPAFPIQDFAAQSDTRKAYLNPADLPLSSIFRKVGFTKFIRVYDIILVATEEVDNNLMIHGANIAASILDSDGDSQPDNPEVSKSLSKYNVIIGYFKDYNESSIFWKSRYINPLNAGFREQYACNFHFFEQFANDISVRYNVTDFNANSSNEYNGSRKCRIISSIPFDWSLWYFPFTVTYYGFLDNLPKETKEFAKTKMSKALFHKKYVAQYEDDMDMELAAFLVWSYLTKHNALECHCNSPGIEGVWNICTAKELTNFDSEWSKRIDEFPFFPHKIPGQYVIVTTQEPQRSSFSIVKEMNGAAELTDIKSNNVSDLNLHNSLLNNTEESSTIILSQDNATHIKTEIYSTDLMTKTTESPTNLSLAQLPIDDENIEPKEFSGILPLI